MKKYAKNRKYMLDFMDVGEVKFYPSHPDIVRTHIYKFVGKEKKFSVEKAMKDGQWGSKIRRLS